jgi:mannitol-1-/sugar-/sorbitol-6-/2-deoxyglucose-6-phosphatase
MLKATIFDMDGLLIDSEPFWKEAEKKIFSQVGIDLTFDMMLETVWLKVNEVVEYWFQGCPWNIDIFPKAMIWDQIVDEVISLVSKKWQWKDGYREVLDLFHTIWWKIWLNSASDYRLIEMVLEKLWIRDSFEVIHSGQDEIYGKPHPGWYIHTAEKLGVLPTECLVFEDSLNGIISAKSARMMCIAIPEEHNWENSKFAIADMVLHSLDKFDEEKLKKLTA